jgi:hypothetical protein
VLAYGKCSLKSIPAYVRNIIGIVLTPQVLCSCGMGEKEERAVVYKRGSSSSSTTSVRVNRPAAPDPAGPLVYDTHINTPTDYRSKCTKKKLVEFPRSPIIEQCP